MLIFGIRDASTARIPPPREVPDVRRPRPLFTALSRLLDAYTRGDVVSTRDIIEQLKTEMDPRMPEEELAIVIAREASGRGISVDLDSRD
jgi:hypothetical protein